MRGPAGDPQWRAGTHSGPVNIINIWIIYLYFIFTLSHLPLHEAEPLLLHVLVAAQGGDGGQEAAQLLLQQVLHCRHALQTVFTQNEQ